MAFDYGTIQSQWWGDYDIGTGIADQIVDALVNDGSFRVIERKKLDTILAEQDFAQSDRAAPDAGQAVEGRQDGRGALHPDRLDHPVPHLRPPLRGRGRRARWRRACSGPIGGLSFRKVKHEVKLTARLIDTTTGEVVVSATGEGRSNEGPGCGGGDGHVRSGERRRLLDDVADYRTSGIAEAQEKATLAVVQAILQKRRPSPTPAPPVKEPVVSR